MNMTNLRHNHKTIAWNPMICISQVGYGFIYISENWNTISCKSSKKRKKFMYPRCLIFSVHLQGDFDLLFNDYYLLCLPPSFQCVE